MHLSNVEQYLTQDGIWTTSVERRHAADDRSTFIRSARGNGGAAATGGQQPRLNAERDPRLWPFAGVRRQIEA
jgi:hypothetical protein